MVERHFNQTMVTQYHTTRHCWNAIMVDAAEVRFVILGARWFIRHIIRDSSKKDLAMMKYADSRISSDICTENHTE